MQKEKQWFIVIRQLFFLKAQSGKGSKEQSFFFIIKRNKPDRFQKSVGFNFKIMKQTFATLSLCTFF
ncbi:hypothetical protein BOW57_07400 [Flavobacterium sp. YO64]|nr:hypothetical protein BOW57_07400 [Flavobacterium sp. YO64]